MTLNQQSAQNHSLDIYIIISNWKLLHVSIHMGQSSGNQTKAITHKNKLSTFVHSWYGVKEYNS
jgi:hypothetical protein